MLTEKEMKTAAEGLGFTAVWMDTADIATEPSFRKYCEDNLCGNYNANYACPPDCGTPAEMDAKIRAWKRALVLQTSEKVKNAMDGSETAPMKDTHNKKTLQLLKQLKEQGLDGCLTIMAGACGLCETCRKKLGEPCLNESARYSCLSAYCVDVVRLAEQAQLPLSWSMDQASFFSILLTEKAEG